MDLRRVSIGEWVAAGSGVALFVGLFLDWLEELSAWKLFTFVHVLLALLGLTAVALAFARGAGLHLPRWPLVQVGVIALTLTLAFLIEGSEQGTGIWLSALAGAGILLGGAAVPRQVARPRRPRRPRPRIDEARPPPRGRPPVRATESSQVPTRPPRAPEAAPNRLLEPDEAAAERAENSAGGPPDGARPARER